MKLIFFGTPAIAANILEFLLKHQVHVVAVVTKPDQKQGRSQQVCPSAVKEKILKDYPYIPLLQPPKISTEEYREKLAALHADLFVVVAYGEILKPSILEIPPLGCINVHASLLPKYRGAAPMHRAIINGEVEAGVTIMEMVPALDAGDMLHVVKTPISQDMNVGELEKKLEEIGAQALLETLLHLEEKRANKVIQDSRLVTFAPKVTPEECEIHWDQPAATIHNLVRGVTPFPGAWCKIKLGASLKGEEKRLKIKKTRVVKTPLHHPPGEVIKYAGLEWWIATQDGAIELLEVQLEGKKSISAAEFIRGHPCPKF